MQFELLRLSLVPRAQTSLFDRTDREKHDVLRAIFSKRMQFVYRRAVYNYVPLLDIQIDDALLGRIGREIPEVAYHPPEERFEDCIERK